MARQASAKKAKAANGRRGANAPSAEELREYLDEVHKLTDDMESRNAATRGKIGRVYEAGAEKLGVTKTALKKTWKKERGALKETVWAKNKADAADRDAMDKLSQMFGADTAMGRWASALASSIPEGGTDTSSSE